MHVCRAKDVKFWAVDRFHAKDTLPIVHVTLLTSLVSMKAINTSIAEQSFAWFLGYTHTFNSMGPVAQGFFVLAYGRRHNQMVRCKDLRHLNQYSTEKKLRKATRCLKAMRKSKSHEKAAFLSCHETPGIVIYFYAICAQTSCCEILNDI